MMLLSLVVTALVISVESANILEWNSANKFNGFGGKVNNKYSFRQTRSTANFVFPDDPRLESNSAIASRNNIELRQTSKTDNFVFPDEYKTEDGISTTTPFSVETRVLIDGGVHCGEGEILVEIKNKKVCRKVRRFL